MSLIAISGKQGKAGKDSEGILVPQAIFTYFILCGASAAHGSPMFLALKTASEL
jgi:hypothetical protein